ncbi:hypothetical protein L226DRAFT_609446 [Lentinus tigrinus ALCF2SS1-7]|uniref:RNI-like protein n=1 Tax=Lentinus tigrinus ALCF2SS1-6 TaxID=1328759 RepID=A0A5C2SU63_9APHY|nr:hypothetical protein L227DRAFT_649329 [Lentinus tigrinus ALCF2SS1-6]RPD80588.1 hypothetical protein L226DRAFT_609446 [Lentinus tigrinus ALCF2SS1-7]
MNSDLPLSVRLNEVPPADPPLLLHGLDDIRDRLTLLTSLEMGPVLASRFMMPDIFSLFQQSMPSLKDLTLRGTYVAGHRSTVDQVPQPNLLWDNLPRLQTLVLDGVGLPSTGKFGSNLRRLELLNYPCEEAQISFRKLLGALASCVALQELYIHNYLKVANLEAIHSPPFGLAHLSHLKIHDSPAYISSLLPYLHVPGIVAAQLTSHFPKFMINGGRVIPTVSNILPPSHHALRIASLLPEKVLISVDSASVVAMGVAASGRNTTVEGSANLSDGSTRVQTYARTVESVGSIFNIANVTKLVITGEFSYTVTNSGRYVYDTTVTSAMPPWSNGTMYLIAPPRSNDEIASRSVVPTSRPLTPNWAAVLSQFPALRSLCIEDQGGATPPESFATALAGMSTLLCCPHLAELHLVGVGYGETFFCKLAEALTMRSMRGRYPRLKSLTVTICNSARRSIAEEVTQMFSDRVDSIKVRFA